jgi:alpha-beta hydrolase superfamily lysophospholipase
MIPARRKGALLLFLAVLALAFMVACWLLADKHDKSRRTMVNDGSSVATRIAKAVFYPRPDQPFEPEAPGAWDHIFEVEQSVRLRLRFFLAGKNDPVILFFHGNGETARDYDSAADKYRSLPASLVVAEYRGYGPSTGTPSLESMLQDAHLELKQTQSVLAEKGYTGRIVVMGRSLGSAPAIELASACAKDVAGLIVESGFANIIPLLKLLGVPVGALRVSEDQGPRNLAKMGQISLPTLILHAELDEIISIREGELLFEANKDPQKAFLRVPHAGHNDIQFVAGDGYFARIQALLNRIDKTK